MSAVNSNRSKGEGQSRERSGHYGWQTVVRYRCCGVQENYASCSKTHFVKIRRTVSTQSAMEILISTMTLTSLLTFLITTGFLTLWRTSLQNAIIIFIITFIWSFFVVVFVLIIHLFGMSVGHHFLTKLHNPVSSRPSLSLSSVSLHPSDLMV